MTRTNPNIITPCINDTFNLNISGKNSHGIDYNAVRYSNDDNYIVVHKDGGISDVILDETTVELLIEAKRQKDRMSKIIAFIKSSPMYDDAILQDTKVMMIFAKTLSDNPTETELSNHHKNIHHAAFHNYIIRKKIRKGMTQNGKKEK